MALAIFDLDETLIHGDCASLWTEEMVKIGWADGESFIAREQELMRQYAAGTLAMEEYMTFTLSPLVGRSPEEVAHVVEPFVEDVIEPIFYSDARHIGIPVLTPALLGTFIILLANALGAYATVYALTTGNFNILPIRIASLVSGDIFLDPYMASALAMILVGLMSLITLVHQWLLRRSYHVAR